MIEDFMKVLSISYKSLDFLAFSYFMSSSSYKFVDFLGISSCIKVFQQLQKYTFYLFLFHVH